MSIIRERQPGTTPPNTQLSGRRGKVWSGIALAGNQLAIMATNLVLSIQLGRSGGLAAVGAVAPCLLVFQLGSGLLQQVIAEASLLAAADSTKPTETATCRWAVGSAIGVGIVGAGVAVLSASLVPGGSALVGLVFAIGIPAAHGLDIGRAAAVAAHAPRFAAIEGTSWAVAQAGAISVAAAVGSPLWICAAWTIVNWVFFLGSAAAPLRRPAIRGYVSWLRSQRRFASKASIDALLSGSTPLLAVQLAAAMTSATTIGTVRLLQQLFAPLAFISISLRRFLIYRRNPDAVATRRMAVRDGAVAVLLVSVGATMLGGALLVARSTVPGMAFIPAGAALIMAGVEKAAQGLTFGITLSRFIKRDFVTLLRARVVFFVLSIVGLPVLANVLNAPGYLLGSCLASVVYALAVLASNRWSAPQAVPEAAPVELPA
jgi:hypothetical protein